ncbi:alpha/beta fold hydrolase [Leifsonia sp. NPDC080035]|uniref:Acyl-CoA:diacylglycerol acyltransferase n=1 Tax=Leifsonia sp. NPDC080035 TaxID=3143936 RepID=A0AAU7GBR6_9MICO
MTEPDDGQGEAAPARRRVSRRTLIVSGAAAAVVAVGVGVPAASLAGVLPGRSTLYRLLGLDGPAGTVPHVESGPLVQGRFRSGARLGADCGWTIAYPPGSGPGDRLPVAVVLHGYSNTHSTAFGAHAHGLEAFLAQYVADGGQPYAIASVDGGNTYWHPRHSGEDASAMVVDEFLPLLGRHGLDTERIGLLGWSMGGYGALRLAGVLGPSRVAAVAAASPALWHAFPQTPHGSFDDAADFARNTVFGRQDALEGVAVRVDCGTGDGFCANDEDYVAGFASRPAGGFTAGGHNNAYWLRMNPAHVAFVGRALTP